MSSHPNVLRPRKCLQFTTHQPSSRQDVISVELQFNNYPILNLSILSMPALSYNVVLDRFSQMWEFSSRKAHSHEEGCRRRSQ
ncbi:hypothetical protein KCU67_g114, partial [Aureobasidium melanogenum]